jgi:hypothetical protein
VRDVPRGHYSRSSLLRNMQDKCFEKKIWTIKVHVFVSLDLRGGLGFT